MPLPTFLLEQGAVLYAFVYLVAKVTGNTLDPSFELISWSEFGTHPSSLSDLMVCSTETPDLVSNTVISIPDCILLCQGYERCLSVNWKEPSTCEMFFIHIRAFTTAEGCSYFALGNL